MSAGFWDGPSVAGAIEGASSASIRESFDDARDQIPSETEAGGDAQGAESAGFLLEPPNPVRLAEIKAEAGARSLQRVLDTSIQR